MSFVQKLLLLTSLCLCLTLAAGQEEHAQEEAGLASSEGRGRANPVWLKQIAFFTEENKRLKLQVEQLAETLRNQSPEVLEEKRRLAELEAKRAEEEKQKTELLLEKARQEHMAAMAAARTAEVEKLSVKELAQDTVEMQREKRAKIEVELHLTRERKSIVEAEVVAAKQKAESAALQLQLAQKEVEAAHAKREQAIELKLARLAEQEFKQTELKVLEAQKELAEAQAAAAKASAAAEQARATHSKLNLNTTQTVVEAFRQMQRETKEAEQNEKLAALEKEDALAREREKVRLQAEEESFRKREAERLQNEEQAAQAREAARQQAELAIAAAKAEQEKQLAAHKVELERQLAAERTESEKALAAAKVAQEKASAATVLEQEKAIAATRLEQEKAVAATRVEQERSIAAAKAAAEIQVAEAKARQEKEVALAKARAEAEARTQEARDTEEIKVRAAAASAAADKARTLAAIDATTKAVSNGLHAIFVDYLSTVLAVVLGAAAAVYGAREASGLIRGELQRFLGQPSLVRETSRPSGLAALLGIVMNLLFCGQGQAVMGACCCVRRGTAAAGRRKVQVQQGEDKEAGKAGKSGDSSATAAVTAADPNDPFGDVILSKELEMQVRRLGYATANAHKHHAPLRHAMFFGPPGTGKTMVAQRLARSCGLEYALMSGGDVAPLGSQAVQEMNKLFEWAKSSQKGLLLFIDEAEAFLSSRSRANLSEDMRNCLSALLHHTGEQSTKFMLVLATNRPGDLDSAVTDRIDESLFFESPGEAQRKRLGRLYFHKYISSRSQLSGQSSALQPLPEGATGGAGKKGGAEASKATSAAAGSAPSSGCCRRGPSAPSIFLAAGWTLEKLDSISHRAVGFSGRQMSKLFLNMQATAYASSGAADEEEAAAAANAVLTVEMAEAALQEELRKSSLQAKLSLASSGYEGSSNTSSSSTAAGKAAASSSSSFTVPAVAVEAKNALSPHSKLYGGEAGRGGAAGKGAGAALFPE